MLVSKHIYSYKYLWYKYKNVQTDLSFTNIYLFELTCLTVKNNHNWYKLIYVFEY